MDNRKVGEEGVSPTSPLEEIARMRLPAGEVPVLRDPSFREKEQMGEFVAYPYHHILVSPDAQGEAYARTVLHESIHAIDDSFGLGLSESKTRILETALYALIRDNAAFVRTILPNDPSSLPRYREEA